MKKRPTPLSGTEYRLSSLQTASLLTKILLTLMTGEAHDVAVVSQVSWRRQHTTSDSLHFRSPNFSALDCSQVRTRKRLVIIHLLKPVTRSAIFPYVMSFPISRIRKWKTYNDYEFTMSNLVVPCDTNVYNRPGHKFNAVTHIVTYYFSLTNQATVKLHGTWVFLEQITDIQLVNFLLRDTLVHHRYHIWVPLDPTLSHLFTKIYFTMSSSQFSVCVRVSFPRACYMTILDLVALAILSEGYKLSDSLNIKITEVFMRSTSRWFLL